MFEFNKSGPIINMFIYFYIVIYAVIISLFVLLVGWFILWLTGIQQFVLWITFNINWIEIMYLSIVILILGTTGFIFYHLLDNMEQNLILINDDRRNLLQKNLDLINENKELKKMFNKLVKLTINNEEDKKKIDSLTLNI